MSALGHCRKARRIVLTPASEPQFDVEEPDFDEPDMLDDDVGGGADEATLNEEHIVHSGDQQAAQRAADAKKKNKNTVLAEREKKIAKEDRKTTPYMTKYERARVLGTRALQIRYEACLASFTQSCCLKDAWNDY